MVRSLFDLLGAHGAESFHLYSKSKRAGRDMISNRTLNTSISDRSILAAASILDRCSDGLRLLFGRRATAHPLYEIRKTGVSVFRTRSHSSLSRIQVHSRPFSGRFKIIVTQTPLQMQICAQNAYKGFFVLGGGLCSTLAFILCRLVRREKVSFDVRALHRVFERVFWENPRVLVSRKSRPPLAWGRQSVRYFLVRTLACIFREHSSQNTCVPYRSNESRSWTSSIRST